MGELVTLRNSISTYISPVKKGTFGDATLRLSSGEALSYLFFSMPNFPTGAVIHSAKLIVFPAVKGDGATILLRLRKLTSAFDPNALTWVNKPAPGAVVDTESHTQSSVWEFDVTQHVVDGAAGGPWFGWSIETDTVLPNYSLYGSRASNPPQLEINYSAPPPTPNELMPRNSAEVNDSTPTLSWTFVGWNSGSMPAAHQVQIDTDVNFAAPITYDSGERASNASVHNPDTYNYGGLPALGLYWWRVRAKNDSGAWSDWSLPARFNYTGPKSLNITSPIDSTPDPTPLIDWTFDSTQQAYQVYIDQRPSAAEGWTEIYDSSIIYDDDTQYQLPMGVITRTDQQYRVRVRAWAAGNQIALAGATNHKESSQIFTWVPEGAPPPIDLQVLPDGYLPNKIIRWRYTGPVNEKLAFQIFQVDSNGERWSYASYGTENRESPTSEWWRITDNHVKARVNVNWQVGTVLYGVGSSKFNPSVTQTVRRQFPWLISTRDPTRALFFANPEIDPGLTEISDLVTTSDGQPYLVQQSLRGFVGTASGELANEVALPQLSVFQMYQNLLWLRRNPEVTFLFQDQAVKALIYNVAYTPIGLPSGKTDYAISFDFVQVP